MKMGDLREAIKSYFRADFVRDYRELVDRENIRMLYVLNLAAMIFALALGVYHTLQIGALRGVINIHTVLVFMSALLYFCTKRLEHTHSRNIPWVIVAEYVVWAFYLIGANMVLEPEIYAALYYALIGLGCCFILMPHHMIELQLLAAFLITSGSMIFKPWEEARGDVLNMIVVIVMSVGISLIALAYRINSVKRTEETTQILNVTSLYQSIVDETQTGVYVRELGTYELLYMNRKAREIFDVKEEAFRPGQKCYRTLYHQHVACKECPARMRNIDEDAARELFIGGRYYVVKGKIIDWCGREAYVEYLFDVTDAKKVNEQMHIAHDNLQKKYEEEVLYREKAVSDEILSTSRVNLTEGIVEEMRVRKVDGYERQYRHAMDFSERVSSFCEELWLTDSFNRSLSRDGLLLQFERGVTSLSKEYMAELKDGKQVWIRVEVKLLRRPDTSDIIAFFYNKDITRERLLGHVLDRIMSFEYDEIYTVDQIHSRYSGIAIGEYAIGEKHTEGSYDAKLNSLIMRAVSNEDRMKLRDEMSIAGLRTYLEKEQTHLLEVTLVSKSGKPRRKRIRYMYLYEDVGTVLVTITDIEDVVKVEKQRQEQLEQALLMAEEASRAKSSFLASMSHEIRTPMNAIIGLNSIIKSEIDNKEQVLDCSEKLDSASKYLLALLNDILDMSRIESGNMTLAHQTFSVDKFWDNVNILAKTQADLASVEYIFERKERGADNYIGDATRLEQIMINLINNAIKFTSANGCVRVTVCEQVIGNERVRMQVLVADNGIGISKEFLPEVFGMFTQEHAGSTTTYKGSGLGLSIAQSFARMMDGDITVESTEGVGTTFTVNVELDIDRASQMREQQEEMATDRDFTGRQVLLVEDHPLNTIVAKNLLTKRGLIVEHAQDGVEAVAIFEKSTEGSFDAILMDIRMPVMDGIEATMRIRGLERGDAASVPIIAMTANAYEEDRKRTADAGMNAHLAKPIEPKQLFKTLADFIPEE